MHLGDGRHEYDWIDDWIELPTPERGVDNGRTHGIAVTGDDRVVVFRQADPAVLVYDRSGSLLDSWGNQYLGAHGLTLVEEDGDERLWLVDQDTAAIEKRTLAGELVASISQPPHPAYEDGSFVPTWVATAGGDAAVWIADGYGESLVHRYDADGIYQDTIDGTAGAGRFDCPHAAYIDERGTGRQLYIADRGNERLQVYDEDGSYLRSAGADALTSPCTLDVYDGDCVVPELYARVTILDEDDEVITHLGANEAVVDRDDWPNVNEDVIEPGRFNSPHDAAFDSAGNLYVAEWIVGGRVTKLERT